MAWCPPEPASCSALVLLRYSQYVLLRHVHDHAKSPEEIHGDKKWGLHLDAVHGEDTTDPSNANGYFKGEDKARNPSNSLGFLYLGSQDLPWPEPEER